MPKGLFNPLAKMLVVFGFPSAVIPRKTMIWPLLVSATKKSPLGAVRIRRGLSSPVAYNSTLKPFGASGQTPSGRGTTVGLFPADLVAKGSGRSCTVILRTV